MTVKELLEISCVYDHWQVYQEVDEHTSKKSAIYSILK